MNHLHEMTLHETMVIEDGCVVRRVPGGWIYMDYEPAQPEVISSVFVPYSDEFEDAKGQV